MTTPLSAPTYARVAEAISNFDKESFTELAEESLVELRAKFPRNSEASHVLLKVIALDRLYSTRIKYVDLMPLARHIARRNIDQQLDQGAPEAVDLIWSCPETINYYSFATKFCSWHNPKSYPMHDHYVDECLWAYRKQDRFHDFQRQDMYDYAKFVGIVAAFQSHYNLESFSFRELDKFLWSTGQRILGEAQEGSVRTTDLSAAI